MNPGLLPGDLMSSPDIPFHHMKCMTKQASSHRVACPILLRAVMVSVERCSPAGVKVLPLTVINWNCADLVPGRGRSYQHVIFFS